MLATFLGTMGLPHVLVRFYTNIDGGSARATTVRVIALLGVFYLFPTVAGALIHTLMPPPAAGQSDSAAAAACRPPRSAACSATLLAALVAAGAIAAFLATSSGLVVAAAGVLSTDVLRGRVRDFRAGRRGRRAGAAGPRAADHRPGHLPGRRDGVRGGGVDLLPAAGAGHLVARADHSGGDRRPAGRRRAQPARARTVDRDPGSAARSVRFVARPTGRRLGTRGVR